MLFNGNDHPLCKSLGVYTNGLEKGIFVGYTVYELKDTNYLIDKKFNNNAKL